MAAMGYMKSQDAVFGVKHSFDINQNSGRNSAGQTIFVEWMDSRMSLENQKQESEKGSQSKRSPVYSLNRCCLTTVLLKFFQVLLNTFDQNGVYFWAIAASWVQQNRKISDLTLCSNFTDFLSNQSFQPEGPISHENVRNNDLLGNLEDWLRNMETWPASARWLPSY